MKILVIGASGLVGSHVLAEALSRGHEALGTYRNFPIQNLVQLDLANESQTRVLLESFKPEWVVHAAGWTWVDGCEKDPGRAMRENYEQPVMVARLCKEIGIRMVYFSTTYVFDGIRGPYTESDNPSPINVYGASKWDAEKEITAILTSCALVPRVICVWGIEYQRKNFVYQVVQALRSGRNLRLPSDQYGNPTWAGDIALWINVLMERKESGIWNLAGDEENLSRAEWYVHIRALLEALMSSSVNINGKVEFLTTRELAQPAGRPLHAGAQTAKRKSAALFTGDSGKILEKILKEHT